MQLLVVTQLLGFQPNVVTCTAVVSAGGQTLVLFGQMQQRGLQPNVITYMAIQCRWSDSAALQLQLFEEMRKQGLQPKLLSLIVR